MGRKGSVGGTRRPWTAQDDQALRDMNSRGYSDPSIAKCLGRHPQLVAQKRRALGLAAVPQVYEGKGGNWMVVGVREGGDRLVLYQGCRKKAEAKREVFASMLEEYEDIVVSYARCYR